MNKSYLSFFLLLFSLNIQATVYTVMATGDVGDTDPDNMDLRGAITLANANAGHDSIYFDLGAGTFTITLTSNLPALSDNSGVTIDGWENGSNDGTPNTRAVKTVTSSNQMNGDYRIIIAGAVTKGFDITGNNNIIKGIVIRDLGAGAADNAIDISGSNNQVLGCILGLDYGGTTSVANKIDYGVYITGANNIVGNGTAGGANIISGVKLAGVYFSGASATGNAIRGNMIGLQKDGVNTPSNQCSIGVWLTGAPGNTVGGSVAGYGNIISGNSGIGVSAIALNSVISGNYIGTAADGLSAVVGGTQNDGIDLGGGNCIIGGSSANERNIISGNNTYGIATYWYSTTGNVIKGNYIGLGSDGSSLIPSNSQDVGIYLEGSGDIMTIGGTNAGEGNVISGNLDYGIKANWGYSPANYKVYGNIIGLKADGVTYITSNPQDYGVFIDGQPGLELGGSSSSQRNIVSGNEIYGVYLTGAFDCTIKGNYIGMQSNGTTAVTSATQDYGIYITASSYNNTIGGTISGEGNVISGNKDAGTNGKGIYCNSSHASGNKFYGNIIGPQANGTTWLNNNQSTGIELNDSRNNVIGGSASGFRNTISANGTYGTYITGASSTNNQIKGNYIGMATNGTSYITSNSQDYGIYLSTTAPATTIGGTNSGEGNVISGNGNSGIANCYGIYFDNADNSLYGNIIGAKASGTTALDAANNQTYGVYINNKANNIIGGSSSAHRNVISDNRTYGVYITGANATGTQIKGNYIGVATDGITLITSNSQDYGIYLSTTAPATTIGGTNSGEGNVISGNGAVTAYGIYLDNAGNSIYGNYIGPKASGTTSLGANNQDYGIYINNKANNIIGGSSSGHRNVVSDNTLYGIYITGTSATGITIKGNYIGLATNGTSAITSSTQDAGIFIHTDANLNTIGGTASGEGNVISGNTTYGIWLYSYNANGNTVIGNIIGPQKDGSTWLNDAQGTGIFIWDVANNTIGGSSAGHRNIISANATYGIHLGYDFNGCSGNLIKGNYIGIASNGTSAIASATQDYGIYFEYYGFDNEIGGTAAGEGNVISGNSNGAGGGVGIYFNQDNFDNTIYGNIIGPQKDGSAWINNNQGTGIHIAASKDNIIGGSSSAFRNIISANGTNGIYITGATSTGNTIKGNYVGSQSNGTSFVTSSTQDYGVYITGSAANNTIGGANSGEGNLISGQSDAAGGTTGTGIFSNSNAGNTIIANTIGPQSNGTTNFTNNDQSYGIYLSDSPDNTIGGNSLSSRNIISANLTTGIHITGASSTGNVVKGNYIGPQLAGTANIASSDQNYGVYITGSATNNTIGGSSAGEGNVISGQIDGALAAIPGGYGIYIDSDAGANTMMGNTIGLRAGGAATMFNNDQQYGIYISNSPDNIIGGNTSLKRNVISGHLNFGITLTGASTTGTSILGNYIGCNAAGTTYMGQNVGIYIITSAAANNIGGTASGDGNLISGSLYGMLISGAGSGNTILGNIIGPRADGSTYLTSNVQGHGIYIQSSTPGTIIGDGTAGGRNIISGNITSGITQASSATGSQIKGNYLGIASNGTTFIASSGQDYGIWFNGSTGNVIEGNLISGNSDRGIYFNGTSNTSNTIKRNTIGPQKDGSTIVASNLQSSGIYLNSAPKNDIGGSSASERNIISANNDYGVYITGASSTGNTIKGNYIGLALDGTSLIASSSQNYGVYITGSANNNIIGGTNASEGNVISGNDNGAGTAAGVYTNSGNINGNKFYRNIIGPQKDGSTWLNNNQNTGIEISDSPGNIIGGSSSAYRNIISANGTSGIYISGPFATGTTIKGNYIGIASDGASFITSSTQDYGVYITFAAGSHTIGGTGAGEGNVISGNSSNGIIFSWTNGTNYVYQNIIGPTQTGSSFVTGNAQTSGITIEETPGQIIGGSSSAYRNIISANEQYGVYINGSSSTGNTIKGNYIGLASDGTSLIASATQDAGVRITSSATANTIGGTNSGEGNVISGNNDGVNTGKGIYLNSNSNSVSGNIIGPQTNGTTYISSNIQTYGVYVDAANNIIGGSVSGARNIISGNRNSLGYNVYITGASATGNSVKGNYIGLNAAGTNTLTGIGASPYGIHLVSNADYNIIGGSTSAEQNIISGNNFYGIYLASSYNTIAGNFIGPQANGTSAITSTPQLYGVYVGSGNYNTIGGTSSSFRNVIAGYPGGIGINFAAAGTGNAIKANYIGVGSNGSTVVSTPLYGVYLTGQVNCSIGGSISGEGNVISGNSLANLFFPATSCNNTTVKGNIIGLAASGTALPSVVSSYGIWLNSSYAITIGGSLANERNTISGNSTAGLWIQGASASSNVIKGNYIGTTTSGTALVASSSQDYGINILSTGASTTIGGTNSGEGNVISGNYNGTAGGNSYGIYLSGTTIGHSIYGNIIGAAASGTSSLGANNQTYGIYIDNSKNNIIGGTTSGHRNIISDNQTYGIYFSSTSTGNSIKGNYIGTAPDGTSLITGTSQDYGIYTYTNSSAITIGGTVNSNEGNIISGNTNSGIMFRNSSNQVYRNIIGAPASGTTSLGASNQLYGIMINSSSGNIIGGSSSAFRNIISDNSTSGIRITGTASTSCVIKGNYIGLAADGTSLYSGTSQDYGIEIPLASIGAPVSIGGIISGEGNVISGNTNSGIYAATIGTHTVYGNTIGPAASGTTSLGASNQLYGIYLTESPNNIIGGSASAHRNIISDNNTAGVYITGATSTDNSVKGNYIGIATNGTSLIGSSSQDYGIYTYTNVPSTTFGGTNSGEGNLISGNTSAGIYLSSNDHEIYGNIIGAPASGTTSLGASNQAYGIQIFSDDNVIGGSTSNHRNIISDNTGYGIYLADAAASGNIIKGNYIGPNASLAQITGSSQDAGVIISQGRSNHIGGSAGGVGANPEGNVIAYNTDVGVDVIGGAAAGNGDFNLISRNLIYSNTNKAIDLNAGPGIGNEGHPEPTVNVNYTGTTVTGTATANDVIEVFKKVAGGSNHCEQAQTYLGTTTADGSGNWTFSPGGTILNAGETPIATATDNNNNTSEFGCPSTAIGLPVELLSFNAKKINETTVKTYWQTATEVNNDYFTVQRSTDAVEFDDIGIVDGAGNSSSILSYELFDNNFSTLNFPTLYYRLKQTDFDGSYSYSNIVTVDFRNANSSISNFNIFPNPTTGENINISLTADINSEVLIIVRDILGKELYAKTFITTSNPTIINLYNGFILPAGVYTITASNNDELVSKKLVIK